MARQLLLAVVLAAPVFAGACAREEPAAAPAPAVAVDGGEAVAALEREWVAAIVGKDTAAIDRLLADDFVGATDDMRYSKPEAIEDVKMGDHHLEMTDLDVRLFGNTAVATFDQNENSKHGEEDFAGHYHFTNVWVNRDGAWQAVASHGSRAR